MSVPEVEEINISCEAGMEESFPGRIITNIRPTKSLRLILGLISGINLAKINLLDLS